MVVVLAVGDVKESPNLLKDKPEKDDIAVVGIWMVVFRVLLSVVEIGMMTAPSRLGTGMSTERRL